MKKMIASTSIHPPTKAYFSYLENHADWHLVVAGDIKSPDEQYRKLEREYSNFTYLSFADQEKMNEGISNLLGKNTIERRNFSIIFCYQNGADIVALVDDDNIPLPEWGEHLYIGRSATIDKYDYEEDVDNISLPKVIDPVYIYNADRSQLFWHRGFPLQLLADRSLPLKSSFTGTCLIQQDQWLGEPDIDAINRFIRPNNQGINYNVSVFPFCITQFTPFNSQNTFLHRDIIPDFFLFPEFKRMADIWASYYICSLRKTPIVYNIPTVNQERNYHDITRDFEDEILGYLHTLELITAININPNSYFSFLSENSKKCYQLYRKEIGV